MQSDQTAKAKLHLKYPLSSVILYNISTILHYLIGGIGIAIGYGFSPWTSSAFGALYIVLSILELYVFMPLMVCPNCAYYRAKDSLCISGLNLLSKRIAKAGSSKAFHKRSEGLLCPNNLYIASLIIPVLAILPALFLNFSVVLLLLFLAILGLLLFRFFTLFPKIACLHCYAKFQCPQAAAMGVRNL